MAKGNGDKSKPVRLVQDPRSGDRLLIYRTERGDRVELRFDADTLWLSEPEIGQLFGVTRQNVNLHLNNIYSEGELDRAATCKESLQVRREGNREVKRIALIHNLDAIISVGYRVNSKQGTIFRRWATDKLVQFATKGFVIDVERLENPGGTDYFHELLDKIRHIRASEKRMWMRVLELAEFCSDFDRQDQAQLKSFYATIQNALHWAVTQQTAAEVIYNRVDSTQPNCALTTFKGDMPTVAEAQVAKNYYGEAEIKALNLLTSMVLEFFESQAEQRRLTTLHQFLAKMRDLIKLDGRPLIHEGHHGSRTKSEADRKAATEIKAYTNRIMAEKEAAGEKALRELAAHVKQLPKARRKRTDG